MTNEGVSRDLTLPYLSSTLWTLNYFHLPSPDARRSLTIFTFMKSLFCTYKFKLADHFIEQQILSGKLSRLSRLPTKVDPQPYGSMLTPQETVI
jgi:hypothetical protein